MDHAVNHEEYRKWRGELRCHHLMLIPFVNKKNVMRLYNRIWHRADREKKERKDSLVPLLLPSVLGICICTVCVCGMTWAWFSASVETPAQKLTAAHYEIDVGIINSKNAAIIPDENGSYTLFAGTYTVILTAQGDASTGYCKIKISDEENELHTEQIYTAQGENQKNTIAFTIKVEDGSKLVSFLSVWGTYSGKTAEISDGIIYKISAGVSDIPADEPSAPPVTDNPSPAPIPTEPTETTTDQPQDYVIPEPEPTVPQETTPAETEPAPTEPPTTDPSNTPVTDAPTPPEKSVSDEPVSNDTSDPTDPE